MNGAINAYCHPTFSPCIMASDSTAAVYSYPEEKFPICLVLTSPYSLIAALDDLIEHVLDLENAGDILYKLQVYENRVEFHFDCLSYLAAMILLSFLSSVPHHETGDWAFLASEMHPDTAELMESLADIFAVDSLEHDNL